MSNKTSTMSENYDVVIVGAGLGGLATGSMLAQHGRKVLIIERHNKPGGYATNFKRGDFIFDVALHALNGATPGTPSYKCLEACGIADRVEFLPQKNVYRLATDSGDLVVKHGSLEDYKKLLADNFPGEEPNIERIFREAGKMFKDSASYVHSRLPFWLRMAGAPFLFPRLLRYEKLTVHDFLSRFTDNERLKEIISAQWPYYGLPPKRLAFSYFAYPFYDYLVNGGYSIKGGSQVLSDALADVIRENGGTVALSSAVTQIHVENNRIKGVTARKLGRVNAPIVISNVSPYAIVEMAGIEAFPASFHAKLKGMRPAMSAFQVYLGLDCTAQELGIPEDEYSIFSVHDLNSQSQFKKMASGKVGEDGLSWFLNVFTNVDPSLAPPGKATMGIAALVSGNGWHGLDKEAYREKKEALTKMLIERVEARIPGLSKHIEVIESGSPRTMTKYTGNHLGSINGFEQSVHQAGVLKRFPMRYPVKGLYQVGAWTFPGGGYMGAFLSSRILMDRFFQKKWNPFGFFLSRWHPQASSKLSGDEKATS